MAKRKRRVPRYLREEQDRLKGPGSSSIVPEGAIPADLSRQAPNNSWSPLRFYRDYAFNCVDCGVAQVWTAKQQQWWYEVAQGSIYAGARRCRACRAARRAAHRGTPRRTVTERRDARLAREANRRDEPA